ncbi:MAG: hypothetical protein R2881_05695 [Eubacteriales bacterium]
MRQIGIEAIVKEEAFSLIGWRTVPTNLHACGYGAVSVPTVKQLFISWKENELPADVRLFVLRKRIEKATKEQGFEVYIPNLSSKTIVYKGMMQAWQVSDFYPDLLNEEFMTAIALVHSRYSTNTFPNWERAQQPFTWSGTGGEINTLKGCEHAVLAAAAAMDGGRLKKRFADILPILDTDGSDSTKFDNLLEFLVVAGRSLPQALFYDDVLTRGRRTRRWTKTSASSSAMPRVPHDAVGRVPPRCASPTARRSARCWIATVYVPRAGCSRAPICLCLRPKAAWWILRPRTLCATRKA